MKSIIKTTLTIALAVVIVAHSAHAAWTLPTTTPPGGNVAAPLNTGTTSQVKQSSLGILGYLSAYNGFFGPVPSSASYVSSRIFSAMTDHRTGKGLFVSAAGEPVVQNTSFIVDLRANNGTASINGLGRNAINILTSPDNVNAAITTNAPGFHFWSDAVAGGKSAKILAGAITLKDGCLPTGSDCAGKILAADSNGNASWQNLALDVQTGDRAGLVYSKRLSANDMAYVMCNSGDILIGGGGDCEFGIKISQPIVDTMGNTNPDGGPFYSATGWGWRVECLRDNHIIIPGQDFHVSGQTGNKTGAAHAEAICMKSGDYVKSAALTTGTSATTTTNPGGGTPPAVIKSWHYVGTPGSPTASLCSSAYSGYNGNTFSNSEVGYVTKTEQLNGSAWTVIAPQPALSTSDTGMHVGSCATSVSPYHATQISGGANWVSSKQAPQITGTPQDPGTFRTTYYTVLKY